jgi:hypothetical protein
MNAPRVSHRRATVVAVIVCFVLVAPPNVSADQTTRRDDDDVRSFLDIARVRHEHERLDDGSRRIRHTIWMHGRWSARALFPNRCGHLVIRIDEMGGPRVDFSYDGELKAHFRGRRVPTWRPNRRSVTVRLRPRVLAGSDGTYRWQTQSLATVDSACQGDRGYLDAAPDSRWIRHDLG